jgi:hypothetical protein
MLWPDYQLFLKRIECNQVLTWSDYFAAYDQVSEDNTLAFMSECLRFQGLILWPQLTKHASYGRSELSPACIPSTLPSSVNVFCRVDEDGKPWNLGSQRGLFMLTKLPVSPS